MVPVSRGNDRVTEVQFGDLGKQVLRGMRRAIAAFAAEGNNVIIDDLMFEPAFPVRLRRCACAASTCCSSAFDVPIDVVNAREAKRPGRFPGTATSHFDRVHSHCVYDIEVDTGTATPRQCAEQIIARLNDGRAKDAFDRSTRRREVALSLQSLPFVQSTVSKAMLDLYFAPTPNGWKITIMLEECGLEYRVKPVNLGKGDQFKPEFLEISPNNRMPALVDHDAPGGPLSIFESGAILVYLAEKTGRFMPRELHERFDVMQWLFWQVGGLGRWADSCRTS